MSTIRSTLYLEARLHQALRNKSASIKRSMSDLVNEAIRNTLREDETDLASFETRGSENAISYKAFLANLKADGTL